MLSQSYMIYLQRNLHKSAKLLGFLDSEMINISVDPRNYTHPRSPNALLGALRAPPGLASVRWDASRQSDPPCLDVTRQKSRKAGESRKQHEKQCT